MFDTQYNNIIHTITKKSNMPAMVLKNDHLSEDNLMSSLFSSSFVPSQMQSYLLNANNPNTTVYSSMANNTHYYDIDMRKIDGGNPQSNKDVLDIDISYYNTQTVIKYLFLLDLLSNFYHYLIDNKARGFITIKSRYYIKGNQWVLYEKGFFTFDINYKYTSIEGISYFKISNVFDVNESSVNEMCNIFLADILRHLNYINKADIVDRNSIYLQNINAFYKYCRLKLNYYSFSCIESINDNFDKLVKTNLSFCFINLKKYIAMTNNDSSSLLLRNKILSNRKTITELRQHSDRNLSKIKKNQPKDAYNKQKYMKYVLYAVSIIFGLSVVLLFLFSGTFIPDDSTTNSIVIVILAVSVYIITYYLIEYNSVNNVEQFAVIQKYPTNPASSDFFESDGTFIKIRTSSIISKSHPGWHTLDKKNETYWETEQYSYEIPKQKWKKTVVTTTSIQQTIRWTTQTNIYNERNRQTGNIETYSITTGQRTGLSVPVKMNYNGGDVGIKSSTIKNHVSTYWTTATSTSSVVVSYPLDFTPADENQKTEGSEYKNNIVTTYSKIDEGDVILYSFQKGGVTNNASWILFDMGEPIVLAQYIIKYPELQSGPKTFRLIGTDNPKIVDINEIFGTWHTTYDIADVDVNKVEVGNLQILRTVNKWNEPIYNKNPLEYNIYQGDPLHKYIVYDESNDINVLDDIEIDILLVGGGGSGGTRYGGGGGAGAVMYLKNQKLEKGRYTIIIGKGGEAIPAGKGAPGKNGESTTILSEDGQVIFSAAGGGGGGGGLEGEENINGLEGGSSGGSCAECNEDDKLSKQQFKNVPEPTQIDNIPHGKYGNKGACGSYGHINIYKEPGAGGGGGGAGKPGNKPIVISGPQGSQIQSGSGGDGVEIDITGAKVWYGGGGGGGSTTTGVSNTTKSLGGKGGGGNGVRSYISNFAYTEDDIDILLDNIILVSPQMYKGQISFFNYKNADSRYYQTFNTDFKTYFDSKYLSQYSLITDDYNIKHIKDIIKNISLKRKYIYFKDNISRSVNTYDLVTYGREIGTDTVWKHNIIFNQFDYYNEEFFNNFKSDFYKDINNLTDVSNNYQNEMWNDHLIDRFYRLDLYDGVPFDIKENHYVIIKNDNMKAIFGLPNTGGGGGGGGTFRDTSFTNEESNDAAHNSASGAGGSGKVIIRYRKKNMEYQNVNKYRYYALVVDRLLGHGTSLKISDIEFYKLPEPVENSINTIYDFYEEMLKPQIEITGKAKIALDAANAKLEEKKKIEEENAKKMKELLDRLDALKKGNVGDLLDWSTITSNNTQALILEQKALENQGKIDQEQSNIAEYERQIAAKTNTQTELNLEKTRLDNNIKQLKQIYDQLQNMLDNPTLTDEQRRELQSKEQELQSLNTSNQSVETLLIQEKIKEGSLKTLLLKEQKIYEEKAGQLAVIKRNTNLEKERLSNLIAFQNGISQLMNQVSDAENELLNERKLKQDAEVNKKIQIELTEEARIRSETETEIKKIRQQHFTDLENELSILSGDIEANKASIELLESQIQEIDYNTSNLAEYTSNYLINSSNQYLDLHSQGLKLKLDILKLRADIDNFVIETDKNNKEILAYRNQNVNTQKELDKVVAEVQILNLTRDNYLYATKNILSVDKSIGDIEKKISVNMESIVNIIANNIISSAYDRELNFYKDSKEKSDIITMKSSNNIDEIRRNNKITAATIRLMLNIFILSIIILLFSSYLSITNIITVVLIIYAFIIGLYIIDIVRIVHTKSNNYYWK